MSADVKGGHTPGPIWDCKIGTREAVSLPPGCDAPMRQAVQQAFWNITGVNAEFNFSGWSAKLTEDELAVVENRLPSPEHYAAERVRDAAPDLLEALKEARAKIHSLVSDAYDTASADEAVRYYDRLLAKAEGPSA